MSIDARGRFLVLLRTAVQQGRLVKLTLGRHRGADATLRNLLVRPVTLKAGPRLAFVWRHATNDVTKNHPPEEALALLEPLIGADFLDAHLFTPDLTSQLECQSDGRSRLHSTPAAGGARSPERAERRRQPDGRVGYPPSPSFGGLRNALHPQEATPSGNDRTKSRPIAANAAWLQALGVTNASGRPREGMAPKFRQIEKFAELLEHLLIETDQARLRSLDASYDAANFSPALRAERNLEAAKPPADADPLSVVDMGCGKGYLSFAVSALLGGRARVRGIEARPELVELCNRIAGEQGFGPRLEFTTGTIADTPPGRIDILIALHACDTATDDALAKGIAAGARLLLVAPCCQKEVRPQLSSPPVLAAALRHGIFQERQAEFATDALRAQLLEWAGYRTKVFEFVSTEHTAKNLMIAGIKTGGRHEAAGQNIREFAAFFGIRRHSLARQLGFELESGTSPVVRR